MVLQNWCKNKGAVETSRHLHIRTLQRAQKRCSPTSQRCQATSRRSGLVLGQFSTHFESIIEGFKVTNPINIRGEGFLAFLGREQVPFRWKHPRVCSWKR